MNEISLYFHIPFCCKKCAYCDFYSITDLSLQKEVLTAQIQELTSYLDLYGNPAIKSIFIGGGTPNSVPAVLLESFLFAIAGIAGKGVREWTVEANPEYLTCDYLSMFAASPVTRLSIGVQSFDGKLLSVLQRNTDADTTLRAVETAVKIFPGDLSVDLICEIPGQAEISALKDLETAAGLGIGHISRYALSIEEGTPFHSLYGSWEMPENDIYSSGISFLNDHGYTRYEVSNFALPGKECVHNLGYWDLDPYLGCGPSAVSTISCPSSEGFINWSRRENVRSVHGYLKECEQAPAPGIAHSHAGKTEQLEWKDLLFEHLMMGFRTRRGVSPEKLSARFPEEFRTVCDGLFEHLSPYCEKRDGRITLKQDVFDYQERIYREALVCLDNLKPP